jgi:hypothetical protein
MQRGAPSGAGGGGSGSGAAAAAGPHAATVPGTQVTRRARSPPASSGGAVQHHVVTFSSGGHPVGASTVVSELAACLRRQPSLSVAAPARGSAGDENDGGRGGTGTAHGTCCAVVDAAISSRGLVGDTQAHGGGHGAARHRTHGSAAAQAAGESRRIDEARRSVEASIQKEVQQRLAARQSLARQPLRTSSARR